MKNNIKKEICLLFVLVLVFSLSACGSNLSNHSYVMDELESVQADSMARNSGISGLSGYSKSAESASSYYAEDYSEDYNNEDSVAIDTNDTLKTEKLVYTSSVRIETKDMSVALDSIYDLINKYDAIIQTKKLNDVDSVYYDEEYSGYSKYNRQGSTAYIFIRVPQQNYDVFMEGLSLEDNNLFVTDIEENIENMTDVYYDSQVRLRALQVEEDRLFDFLKGATNVSEMLSVEDRLTEVQYEIDAINNKLKAIDNDVKYAKVTLNIREVLKYTQPETPQKNLWERVKYYISDSVEVFLDTLETLLKALIYLLPHIVLISIGAALLIKVIRSVKKILSKKSKNKKKNKVMPSWVKNYTKSKGYEKVQNHSDEVIGELESEDADSSTHLDED